MCLGVPGRVAAWIDRDPLFALAEIDFGGVKKRVQMACVPDAHIDDYVLVHAGVALTIIDRNEAEMTLRSLTTALPRSLEVFTPGNSATERNPGGDRP